MNEPCCALFFPCGKSAAVWMHLKGTGLSIPGESVPAISCFFTCVFSTISDFGWMKSEMRTSQRILGHLHWQPSANLSVGKKGRNSQEDKCVAGKGETCDCEHSPPGFALSFPSPQIRHISGRKHAPVSGFRELMTALMKWENKFFFCP